MSKKNKNQFAHKVRDPSVLVFIIISIFLITLALFGEGITGFFVNGQNWQTFDLPVNISLTGSGMETFSIDINPTKFDLKSLKISGGIAGGGSARLYLVSSGRNFLIMDANKIGEGGLGLVTGNFISINDSATGLIGLGTENDNSNESAEILATASEAELIVDEMEPSNLEESKSVVEDFYLPDEPGIIANGLDEFVAVGELIETNNYSGDATNGSELPIGQEQNNTTISSTPNEAVVEVIKLPKNTELDKVKNEQVKENISAGEINFMNICSETCLLPDGLNSTSFSLRFEVETGTQIHLDRIWYALNDLSIISLATNVTYEKIIDATNYDVIIDSAQLIGSDLFVSWHHNSNLELPVNLNANVKFLSNNAAPGENITFSLNNWDNAYLRLVVGEEIIEFGRPKQIDFSVDVKDYRGRAVETTIEFSDADTKIMRKQIESSIPRVNGLGSLSVIKSIDTTIPEGKYNVKIKPKKGVVKQIEIHDFSIVESVNDFIDIDDVPETGKFESYVEVYAIDPTKLNFTNATVTVTATGTELYKCKNWNFAGQSCDGEWELFKTGLTPGQDYTFILTPDDPGFAETVSACSAESLAAKGSFAISCDVADGSNLELDDGLIEIHQYKKNGNYGGVRIQSVNTSITDCTAITTVKICYEWWGESTETTDCDVSVDANGGASYTAVTTSCPGTSANPGVICTDVTSLETWTCANFFGASGTRAYAKSEAQGTQGPSQDLTWDVLHFNVTYASVPDITAPNIELVAPTTSNGSIINSLVANVTAVDDTAIDLITLNLYNITGLVQSNISSLSPLYVSYTNLPDGTYYLNATVNDTSNNLNQTETRTIILDTILPAIQYVSPTAASGLLVARNFIELNVTSTDDNLANITNFLYNSTGIQINSSLTTTSPNYVKFSSLADGLYYYNSTSSDSAGNANSTITQNITLDLSPPESASNLVNISQGTTWIYWNWTESRNSDFNASILFIDGVPEVNLSKGISVYNKTGLSSGTSYTITIHTRDNLGNVNNVDVNHTATTLTAGGNPDYPTFSNASVDDTLLANGDVARFSLDITDASDSISSANGTINAVVQIFTQGALNQWYYDYTCSASDNVVDFTLVSANDTGTPVNSNSTSITGVQTECDALAPSIGTFKKNPSPSYNDNDVILNATITDSEGNLATVWVSGNWTGSWANYTEVTNFGSEYSFVVNSGNFSNQEHVGWIFYANDTAGNFQAGTMQTFTIQNRVPTKVTLVEIVNNTITADNTTFFNWSSATDADLDSLTYILQISNLSDFSTTIFQKSGLVDTNYTLSVAEALAEDTYYWRVYTNDSYITNISDFWQFEINPNLAIAVSLSNALGTSINWTVVSIPSINLSADNNNGSGITQYDLAISASGTNVDVYIKGDGDLSTVGGDKIGIGNETFSFNLTNSSVPDINKIRLTTNYSDNKIGTSLTDGAYIYLKFFLDIIAGQAAGSYTNNVSIKAVPQGQEP